MKKIDFINPWNDESFGFIENATAQEVQETVHRAREEFVKWSKVSPRERIEVLKKIRYYIIDNMDYFIQGISRDTGKVYMDALTSDIYATLEFIKYYEKNLLNLLRTQKVKTPIVLFGKKSYVEYKPMGVIAVISPWNYPFHLAVTPVISSLAAGNCVILKPSEVTSHVGVLIEKIFKDLSLPLGVLQVLHGGGEVGRMLVEAKPDKIFFTGSVATGKKIMAESSKNLIPVELELGGKDPMIVLEDANIDRAVNGALWGGLTNCGQVCMSVERVYVHERIYDLFIDKLTSAVKKLSYGNDYYEDIGSMTFGNQIDIVSNHIDDAINKGAKVLVGGGMLNNTKSHFMPTILVNVNHDMLVMREETFGPVIPIMKIETEEQAITLANDSNYGLNSSVWTKDIERGKRIASKLISGNCCINDVIISVANPNLPFGGVKESGMGRYHAKEGIYTFCHQTSVIVDKGKKKKEVNWYPYSEEGFESFKALVELVHGRSFKLKNIYKAKTLLRKFFAKS